MSRKISSIYEEDFTPRLINDFSSYSLHKNLNEPALNIVKLNNNLIIDDDHTSTKPYRSKDQWISIFPDSCFFQGFDSKLQTNLIIMIYEDPNVKIKKKLSSVIFTSFGEFYFNGLKIDSNSRFFPSCENLNKIDQNSNVKKCLAITILKFYSLINSNKQRLNLNKIELNEIFAGQLASKLKLISNPLKFGLKLLDNGYLQLNFINSLIIDVIYDDKSELIESNNRLVYLLGKQLDQLFDPMVEYSPESTDLLYTPPTNDNDNDNVNDDDELIKSICNELINVQENITQIQVNFLQKFVIPLRYKCLNNKIPISIENLNQIFPATLDEIIRINCKYLEALKIALPFGSFEIVKVCGLIIPYFYKPYTRHESTMKQYGLKFFKLVENYLPKDTKQLYESILRDSNLNLLKIKLILERLINTKNWNLQKKSLIDYYFSNSINIIDSFGKQNLLLNSYNNNNKRIFTPSGKILIEICENWPSILSYGWLNRKIISIEESSMEKLGNIIIIVFNDYIVFVQIENDNKDNFIPKISDILMNSLINENPIKFNELPNLKVVKFVKLSEIEIILFDQNKIKILFQNQALNDNNLILKFENQDNKKFIELINRAKILGKSTPFHLFKFSKFGLNIYSIAHERGNYLNELIRSKISIFLNIEINLEFLQKNQLFAAFSIKFIDQDEDLVEIYCLNIEGENFRCTINCMELSSFISQEISILETKRFKSKYLGIMDNLIKSNDLILRNLIINNDDNIVQESKILNHEDKKLSSNSSISNKSLSNQSLSNKSLSNKSLSNKSLSNKSLSNKSLSNKSLSNKSLSNESILRKKSKFDKLINFLKFKKSKSLKSIPLNIQENCDNSDNISNNEKEEIKRIHSNISIPPKKVINSRTSSRGSFSVIRDNNNINNNNYNNEKNHSITEDENEEILFKKFQSKMSAIVVDDDDKDDTGKVRGKVQESDNNWELTMTRDNSSLQGNLQQLRFETELENIEEFRYDETEGITLLDRLDKLKEIQKQEHDEELNKEEPKQEEIIVSNSQAIEDSNKSINEHTLSNSKSMDFDVQSPVLKIGFDSSEDLGSITGNKDRDNEGFYTPMNFESRSPVDDSQLNMFDDYELFNFDKPVGNSPDMMLKGGNLLESTSSDDSSFKSCLDVEKQIKLTDELIQESELLLSKDDSFKYLAGLLDNSMAIVEVMKKSETYKSLPRSYSSLKYLAAYVDNDTYNYT
ncbi:hypothetical protein WICMUC_000732 [Wickerhamomyces mucosus]|uniref:DH domain-containing protein n=1 Tax=Wickerhamomyces mucosus TaxID=1378264 RepID=A0A9P8PWR4_9ASCO|nr:hypothetical protein WICMUC_000732 [Wickerhamomyces mucosus]